MYPNYYGFFSSWRNYSLQNYKSFQKSIQEDPNNMSDSLSK